MFFSLPSTVKMQTDNQNIAWNTAEIEDMKKEIILLRKEVEEMKEKIRRMEQN